MKNRSSTSKSWLLRLGPVLLIMVLAGGLSLWLAAEDPFSADGVASVRQIRETFRDPPSLEPWLESLGSAEGNASLHYVQALLPFQAAPNPGSEDLLPLDSALPHLTRAAQLRQCRFTGEVYPVSPDLLSTEILDFEALQELLDALWQRAREHRMSDDLVEARDLLALGLALGDCLVREPVLIYFMAGLRVESMLLPELAAVEAQLGNTARVELAVERAAWVGAAQVRTRAAAESFVPRTASSAGLSQLRRLAAAQELPAGLRGEIVLALSYGHLWKWRGRLLGPSRDQVELLEELGREADPTFAQIVAAAQNLHELGFYERMASMETIDHLKL